MLNILFLYLYRAFIVSGIRRLNFFITYPKGLSGAVIDVNQIFIIKLSELLRKTRQKEQILVLGYYWKAFGVHVAELAHIDSSQLAQVIFALHVIEAPTCLLPRIVDLLEFGLAFENVVFVGYVDAFGLDHIFNDHYLRHIIFLSKSKSIQCIHGVHLEFKTVLIYVLLHGMAQ